jgi:hypothetical protein
MLVLIKVIIRFFQESNKNINIQYSVYQVFTFLNKLDILFLFDNVRNFSKKLTQKKFNFY